MHAVHVVAKIMYVDAPFYCELVLVPSQVPLKRGRVELHIDTKNKTKAAEIANREIIQFSVAYG